MDLKAAQALHYRMVALFRDSILLGLLKSQKNMICDLKKKKKAEWCISGKLSAVEKLSHAAVLAVIFNHTFWVPF